MRLCEFYYSPIEIKGFLCMKNFCFDHIPFPFNGSFYQLTECLDMRNSFSSIFCDIFVHYFQEILLNKYIFKCWLHYVSDIFVLFDKNYDRNIFFLFYLIELCIQFIHEEWCNNSLSFLDILIWRQDSVSSVRSSVNLLLLTCYHVLNKIIHGNRKFLFFILICILSYEFHAYAPQSLTY